MPTIPSHLPITLIKLSRVVRRALTLELVRRDLPQNYGNAATITGADLLKHLGTGPAKAAWWDAFREKNPVRRTET